MLINHYYTYCGAALDLQYAQNCQILQSLRGSVPCSMSNCLTESGWLLPVYGGNMTGFKINFRGVKIEDMWDKFQWSVFRFKSQVICNKMKKSKSPIWTESQPHILRLFLCTGCSLSLGKLVYIFPNECWLVLDKKNKLACLVGTAGVLLACRPTTSVPLLEMFWKPLIMIFEQTGSWAGQPNRPTETFSRGNLDYFSSYLTDESWIVMILATVKSESSTLIVSPLWLLENCADIVQFFAVTWVQTDWMVGRDSRLSSFCSVLLLSSALLFKALCCSN